MRANSIYHCVSIVTVNVYRDTAFVRVGTLLRFIKRFETSLRQHEGQTGLNTLLATHAPLASYLPKIENELCPSVAAPLGCGHR